MKHIKSMRSFAMNESKKASPLWAVICSPENIERGVRVFDDETQAKEFFQQQEEERQEYLFSRYVGGDVEDKFSDKWEKMEAFDDFLENHYDREDGEPSEFLGPFFVNDPAYQDTMDAILGEIEYHGIGPSWSSVKPLLENGLPFLKIFKDIDQLMEFIKDFKVNLDFENMIGGNELKDMIARSKKSKSLFGI